MANMAANAVAKGANEVALPASSRFSFVRGLHVSDYLTLANGMGGAGAVLAVLAYMSDGRFAWLALALALHPIRWRWTSWTGAWRARAASPGAGRGSGFAGRRRLFRRRAAAIGFAVGLRGGWDVLALLFLVACAIGRLARYNVTRRRCPTIPGRSATSRGSPSPAACWWSPRSRRGR